MRVDASRGTLADILGLVPAHAPLIEAVRALVAEVEPEATEVASPRERSVFWCVPPGRVRDGFAYAMPHARWVNLGLYDGARLPDPEGLLEGTGVALRHVKLRVPADLDRPALRALLTAARDLRRGAP